MPNFQRIPLALQQENYCENVSDISLLSNVRKSSKKLYGSFSEGNYYYYERRKSTIRRKRQYKITKIAAVFAGLITMVISAYIVMISYKPSKSAQRHHRETIPTFLAVKDPVQGGYVYALDNPLYKLVKRAEWVYDRHGDLDSTGARISAEHDENSGVTVTWQSSNSSNTSSNDYVASSVRRKDYIVDSAAYNLQQYDTKSTEIIVLHCGESRHHLVSPGTIIDMATVDEALATSLENNNVWNIGHFPHTRYDSCVFGMYEYQYNLESNIFVDGDAADKDKYDVDNDDGPNSGNKHSDTMTLVALSDILSFSVTQPSQLHLSLTNDPRYMTINFVTGGTSGTPIAVITSSTDSSTKASFTGKTTTYTANDMCHAPANVVAPGKFSPPGLLHSVTMGPLTMNTTYVYKVGFSHGQGTTWSEEYRFTTAPPVGSTEPVRFVVYGDQGCPEAGWDQGGKWMKDMTQRESPLSMVHHVGDLSYANGASHQWDAWMNMIEPLTSRVPLLVGVGNHEYDYYDKSTKLDVSGESSSYHPEWGNFGADSRGECGVPISRRFTMPQSTHSNGVFWYAYSYASIRTVVISSEHDLSPGSRQYLWLQEELASVNRTITPWLILESHRPLYESEASWSNNAVGIAMRYEFEDLLREYQVDVVFSGHYHAYLCTCDGLYRNKCGQGGPMHVTIGSAGAALDTGWTYENSWTKVFIKQEYGYGRVTVHNSTAMQIEFVQIGAGTVRDSQWLLRER